MKNRHTFLIFSILFFSTSTLINSQILSGDYYIPQGTNQKGFATLADALASVNTNGISGTVRFFIDDSLSEIGANLVLNRSDLSSVNNLVIKPAVGKTPTVTITGCAASTTTGTQADTAKRQAGFTLVNTPFVTIDGSNTVSGTSRDLTFLMNDGTNGIQVINLFGNCDNVVIKNIKVNYLAIPTSTSTRSIYCNGQWTGVVDSLFVMNNQLGDGVLDAYYAVSVTGASSVGLNASKIYLQKNSGYGRLRTFYFFRVGTANTTCEISNNVITTANAPASGNVVWGMLLNTYNGTMNFFNNKIHTLKSATSGTEGIYGLGTLSGAAEVVFNVYNNFFGGDFQHTGTGTPASIDLISFQDNIASAKVYHNTVVLNDMAKTASSRMTCIRFGGTANVEIKNNIIINNKDAAVAYGIYFAGGTMVSDYNNIFISGSNGNTGYSNATARKTFQTWKDSTNQDLNSVSKLVNFSSPTDFHLFGDSRGDSSLAGISIPWIEFDIDGDKRNSTPYIGADEDVTKPIPVGLISFYATEVNGSVVLKWSTATETNNYGFEIERASSATTPGQDEWTKIAFVKGAGTTTEKQFYSYTDQNSGVTGKISYRLKQIDFNGVHEYSKTVEVDLTVPAQFELSQNYPNPFNPATSINIMLPVDARVTLQIFSINGELLETLLNEYKSAGSYTAQFNAAKYASGTYIYRLTAGNKVISKKMTLLK